MDTYVTCQVENGSINISEDVIAGIIKGAVGEVPGVAGLSNVSGAELVELLGIKTVSKGIKVQLIENQIIADVIITVFYGKPILEVAKQVQANVLSSLQTVTGFDSIRVNIHVSGITFEKG